MAEYIERRHIHLTEETDTVDDYETQVTTWTASVDGPLTPSKVWVSMDRSGHSTAEAALEDINAAVEAQGWEIR